MLYNARRERCIASKGRVSQILPVAARPKPAASGITGGYKMEQITIYERWAKLKSGEVIQQWSFDGEHWQTNLTAYSEVPFVKVNLLSLDTA